MARSDELFFKVTSNLTKNLRIWKRIIFFKFILGAILHQFAKKRRLPLILDFNLDGFFFFFPKLDPWGFASSIVKSRTGEAQMLCARNFPRNEL